MEFLNRLQFVHCDTLFATREDAIKYVESMHNIKRPALYAEPMILKYGQEENPNIILAIGSIGTGVADMANKTFFIDLAYVNGKLVELEELANANREDIEYIKNILENIKASCGFNENGEYIKSENDILKDATNLSEADEILALYIQALEKRLALFVENTNSLELTLTNTNDGMTLKGDVLLAKNIIVNNKLVQPNILLSDNNGLFVNVELDYQSDINSLIFGVNGVNKEIQLPEHINVESGIYSPATEEIIITMNNGDMVKIAMGELIREWTVKEDSNTPIVLSLEQVTSEDLAHGAKKWQDILTADVRISDDMHAPFNILTKDEDGRSLRVDGLANKIQYQIADKKYITVQEAIDNIDFEYNAATNILAFTFANKEVKSVPLNSVQLLDEIRYDANTESIIIIYKDTYNQNQKITIPVGDLIAEWEVENAEHTITLTKTRNVQGLDVLTADVNVTDKGVNNNILEILNGRLYVNGIADNIKYANTTVKSAIDTLDAKAITNANAITQNAEDIAKEVANRIAKDETIDASIVSLNESTNINKQNIADEIVIRETEDTIIKDMIGKATDSSAANSVYGAIKAESSRAIAAENMLNEAIIVNQNNISHLSTTTATKEELKNTEATVKEYADSLVLVNGVAIDVANKKINVKVSESIDNLVKVVDDALYVSNDDIKAEYQAADKVVEDKVNATIKANTSKVVNANNTVGVKTITSETEGTEYQVKVNVSEIEGNILAQTNTDGIYATVGLDYNAATNTLTFKSSNNSNKEIKLNAGTIISGAYYDAEGKDLVIEYKIDNVEAIQTVRIPVESFYTPLEVKEGNSTVVLAINDGKISAKASVSTLSSNILEVDADSALYVNGDNFVSKEEYTQGINSIKIGVKAADNDEHIAVSSSVGTNGEVVYIISSNNIPTEDGIKAVDNKVTALQGVVTTTQNTVTTLQTEVNGIKSEIDAMDVADIEIANQYVSSVKQINGKISVERQILPNYSGQITDTLTEAKQYIDESVNTLNDTLKVYIDDADDALRDELKKYADEAGKVKSLTSSNESLTVSNIDGNGNIDIIVNNIDFGTY